MIIYIQHSLYNHLGVAHKPVRKLYITHFCLLPYCKSYYDFAHKILQNLSSSPSSITILLYQFQFSYMKSSYVLWTV